ncbi:MAG TPA: haloacid dehalogenase-like hydrolase [Actinobacteria bacterium]|nr:haloacid dehalogenase-like hydrolase [Actinomycetota bacterium]
MPVPLYTQTVIAFIWDFDRTVIPGNMQEPIFAAYGVDAEAFWEEVGGLTAYYAERGVVIQPDLAYLGHLLTYVREGRFPDLTNRRLRELGAEIEPAPGMPEFMKATQERIAEVPEFVAEGITVEHYIVSTGIRPMIEGSVFAGYVDGIWANTLIERPAPPGYLDRLPVDDAEAPVSQLGYTIDNTSKTRAIFEINKGVNKNPEIDVNAQIPENQRRVPLRNMIYVADGPSDVPVFSILNRYGGKTLGVYTLEPKNNHRQVKQLQEQGRIQGMAEADYRPGKAAYLWLMDSLEQIAYEIVEARRQAVARIPKPPGHV